MENKNKVQLIWGAALVLMGVGVFFRVPTVVQRMSDSFELDSALYFLRFSFYLIGIILIGGGIKKIQKFWPSKK